MKSFINTSQTLRYIRPPDAIVTQIDVYTEEKFEDEEDLRERTRTVYRNSDGGSELELVFTMLNDFSSQQETLRPLLVDALRNLGLFTSRETAL